MANLLHFRIKKDVGPAAKQKTSNQYLCPFQNRFAKHHPPFGIQRITLSLSIKSVLGDVVVVKTVPMSFFSQWPWYIVEIYGDSPNARPKKYGLVQRLLRFTYSLINNPWTRPYFFGGVGIGGVPLDSHEYTSPAFRLFNLTVWRTLRSSSLLTYYPILIYFILAGCTQNSFVQLGHPPSGAWKNGSPPRCRFELSQT